MANCSTPNSIPETGQISTRSSRRSRRPNYKTRASVSVIRRWVLGLQKRRQVRHCESVRWRTAPLQSAVGAREIWMLDVGRWTFSSSGRVKGAWWPSRSSKPSSPRKWRGRFDSYPLRPNNCDSCSRFAVRNGRVAHRATATAIAKGGDTDVA